MLNNNISFGANIKVNDYLNEAIHLVDVKSNRDEVSSTKKAEFVTALNLIMQDKSMDTFEIRAKEGTRIEPSCARPAEILINGVPCETLEGVPGAKIFDGNQCMSHVINFAKEKYGKLSSSLIKKSRALENQAAKLHEKTEKSVHFLTGTSVYEVYKKHSDYMKRNPELEELGLF